MDTTLTEQIGKYQATIQAIHRNHEEQLKGIVAALLEGEFEAHDPGEFVESYFGEDYLPTVTKFILVAVEVTDSQDDELDDILQYQGLSGAVNKYATTDVTGLAELNDYITAKRDLEQRM